MAQNDRSLAIGVSYVGFGAYLGAGVPAATYTQIKDVSEGSVVFNFNEPTQTNINIEGTDDPRWVVNRKGDPDSIELAIPSPSVEDMVMFCGGENNNGVWEAPTSIPTINMSMKMITEPYDSKYTEYVIVNGSVVARLSQAPGKEQSELLLVKITRQLAVDATGTLKTPFTRAVKDVPTEPEG